MRHDAEGWWVAEAGRPTPLPPLTGEVNAEVVVVGGGYTGMWAAWHVLAAQPDARVVLLEANVCGTGPSGRNGGFVNSLWYSLPRLLERHGEADAVALCRASAQSVEGIGAFCAAEGVDAWYRPVGHLVVSTAPAQDGICDAAVAACARVGSPEEYVALTADQVSAHFDSPVVRGGALMRCAATVQPARLAFGLRERLLAHGVRVSERTRVLRLDVGPGGVVAHSAGGRVRAGAAIVAVNAAAAGLAPLRGRFTVASSHMVMTEPVPDVVDACGWEGGECVSDARALLHYMRPTPDGRIAFGWAGGRMAYGARLGRRVEVDPAVTAETARRLVRFFPALGGARLEHAWGGPIDISPDHLPQVGPLPGGPAWFAAGFTGNGVGPSHLAGGMLASLALGRDDELARLARLEARRARVPPEPLRWLGGMTIRAALRRCEAAEDAGRDAGRAAGWVAALPRRMGVHVGR